MGRRVRSSSDHSRSRSAAKLLHRASDKRMTDTLSPSERSERMSRIKSKNSTPEVKLRRLIHGMGFRYRLHKKGLPGKPDLVFKSRRAIVFMHGCFWHRHGNCHLARLPKSRVEFWEKKLESNRIRDKRNLVLLRELGWESLVVWECELTETEKVRGKIQRFLKNCERGK